MATARCTRLTLHPRCHAARATATPFHFFIPGGTHHPVLVRRVSVRNYIKSLRRAGYVVKTYHPAPLGTSDPTKGGSLCYRNVRYFLPPDNDADYLVKTLRNQTRASWFQQPHYAIVLIRNIFVVSRHY
jgi:hypothetical protein